VIFIEQNFGPHIEQNADLVGFLGQGLVVVGAGGVGIEPEVELVVPAKSKRARESASSRSCAAGWPLARSEACAAIL